MTGRCDGVYGTSEEGRGERRRLRRRIYVPAARQSCTAYPLAVKLVNMPCTHVREAAWYGGHGRSRMKPVADAV